MFINCYKQILTSAVEKMNVMIMQHAIIHLVATYVTATLDIVEMEGTVQVCARTFFITLKHDRYFHTDINECEITGGSVLCDENADCSDTDGSFYCLCKTGYSGDGFNCSGVFIFWTVCIPCYFTRSETIY